MSVNENTEPQTFSRSKGLSEKRLRRGKKGESWTLGPGLSSSEKTVGGAWPVSGVDG